MKLNRNYSVETIAGQQVLLPVGQAVIDGCSVYHLNNTGSWVLSALTKEMDFDQLFALAASHFQAESQEDQDTLRRDLLTFLDEARANGLVE